MAQIPIKVYDSIYMVDEANSLVDFERAEPLFFSVKFGKREMFTIYRGCLICRHTVQFTGERPTRRTVAYLWGRIGGKLASFCIAPGGELKSVAQAQRLIDRVLESGVLREEKK